MCVCVYLQECRLASGAAARLPSAGGGGVGRSELAGHRLPSDPGCSLSEGSGPAGGHIRYGGVGNRPPRTYISNLRPSSLSLSPPTHSPPPELFTTEVSHLRTLKVLDQVFFQKMRSVLNPEELACIFPNLPQVYDLHGQSLLFLPSSSDGQKTHLHFMTFFFLFLIFYRSCLLNKATCSLHQHVFGAVG